MDDINKDNFEINTVLKSNIEVYIAADYYNIEELMDLAIDKFRTASKHFHSEGFADVVKMLYDSAPDSTSKFKEIVCDTISFHISSLVVNEIFMETAAQLPGFIEQILPMLVLNHEDERRKMSDHTQTLLSEFETTKGEVSRLQKDFIEANDEARAQKEKVNSAGSSKLQN